MNWFWRLVIALGILSIDLALFFIPLTAIFLAYVILVNPPWFREFLDKLDRPSET